MTDISPIAPIAVRRSNLQRINIPRLRIGASLAAISGLLGDAFKMAYVNPYTSLRRQRQIVPDDDLEGRDPTW
jgi:hypothetical protein